MTLAPRSAKDLHQQAFPSRRSAVLGDRGMVATSQPLAAQAGLRTLHAGGNAIDAAVTAAAALAVVEPTGCGLGGDCFALVYHAATGKVSAFDGSGRSPLAQTRDVITASGQDTMPQRGALSVTVPGAVDAWQRLLDAFGRCSMADVLAPAIRLAEDGYPVSELIASAWRRSEALLGQHPPATTHWLPGGRAPRAGERFHAPAYARCLRTIAEGGAGAFYRGAIAEDLASTCQAAGGYLDVADLAAHRGRWVDPIHTDFLGARIWQCPPPGQGLATLLAMGFAQRGPAELGAPSFGSFEHLHGLIEAVRLAFADAEAHIADPEHHPAPLADLLAPDYLAARGAAIDAERCRPSPTAGIPGRGGTVYVSTVDEEGNGCSLIFSNYMGFGSGLVGATTGIPLQNRGAGFTLAWDHPNGYAPGKRPFHTIIPGLATRADNGSLLAVFGVMGGHMQPQGQLQVMLDICAYDMDPQRALDAPRFQVTPQGRLALEPWFGDDVRQRLAAAGHDLLSRETTPGAGSFGGGQIIALTPENVRVGGSDPRKDGLVATQ